MLISKKAASLTPYVAGEQPQTSGWIKLNTNENPYPAAPRELGEGIWARLRLYPDPNATALKNELAAQHGVNPDCVFVGNGSDEVLSVAFRALFDSDGAPVLGPDVSYSFYPVFASLYEIPYQTVPLRGDFSIDVRDYDRNASGIVLANPNAPTALELPRSELMRLIETHRTKPIVIDEAYADFGTYSMADQVPTHENILVVRTLSKSYSLAGLRVGYAIGSPVLIGAMERIKNCFNSYTVDAVAQTVALNAIRCSDVMKKNTEKIKRTRTRLSAGLQGLGFTMPESSANFVFVTHPDHDGKEIFDALKARKILVRRWDLPRIGQYLRISVGTDEEIDILLAALSEILA